MQQQQQTPQSHDRRAPPGACDAPVPGFYRVRIGSLVEIGDQTLDDRGRPRPISLEQVGREVGPDQVVLRIDRRKPEE